MGPGLIMGGGDRNNSNKKAGSKRLPQSMVGREPSHVLAQARELLRYDPHTGVLYRKSKYWHGLEGQPLLGLTEHGYIRVQLQKRPYVAHRLVWLLHHGEWPKGNIDHINGNRTDNRMENLRECSVMENCRNRRPHGDRIFKGVYKIGDKYFATICANYKATNLGTFETEVEAARAYNRAATEKFGEFAFLNTVPE